MHDAISKSSWGRPPWTISYRPARHEFPERVDFAIVGGGFSGLAAAAWLRRIAPEKSVALFESRSIGAGSSGHTGGMVLAETAAGDLPGLGDVLKGYSKILNELEINCDLTLPGVWEIGRTAALPNSPFPGWIQETSARSGKCPEGRLIQAWP
jgi:glycine/D-amino acid oxidase-like deaminating enzyme